VLRNKARDEKISVLEKILEILSELQMMRQDRLKQLNDLLGIDNPELSNAEKLKIYEDFKNTLA